MNNPNNKTVTVDLTRPAEYLPTSASKRGWLYQLKIWFIYRNYINLLCRYESRTFYRHHNVIAEIGCGPGAMLRSLESKFTSSQIIGFDYDPRLLSFARDKTSRTSFLRGTAERLPFSESSVDVIIALHLIEHLCKPLEFINEVGRVLKGNGLFLLATPNPGGLGAKLMKRKWEGWREDHVSLFKPADWISMMRNAGFISLHLGTTGLSGIPAFRVTPLALLNYLPLLFSGTLPWSQGEAFIGLFRNSPKCALHTGCGPKFSNKNNSIPYTEEKY